eukprot:1368195-Rhodomonas_salina.1
MPVQEVVSVRGRETHNNGQGLDEEEEVGEDAGGKKLQDEPQRYPYRCLQGMTNGAKTKESERRARGEGSGEEWRGEEWRGVERSG